MKSTWRRYEVLLPTQFAEERPVPDELLGEAISEVFQRFGAASYETQTIQGHWERGGVVYRDDLVRLFVDVPDTDRNRRWARQFKSR
jgi:hypothetical protein